MTTGKARQVGRTTAIGSLPHHNVDAALDFSFQLAIPFLPQIPLRNPWEFMTAQALDAMPGLQAEADGTVLLDPAVWDGRARALNDRLVEAFATTAQPDAFAAFEPSAATSSSWQPFLWELEERGVEIAKIQLAGPLTAQWAIRLSDGSGIDQHPEMSTQIFRLVLARAMAMCRRVRQTGAQPILYLDEPALFGLNRANPRHLLAIQELRILIQTLAKEGVQVGLHCCSDTHWPTLLGLGLRFLSIDAGLSAARLLEQQAPLDLFLAGGGRFSFGVIPTTEAHTATRPQELLEKLIQTLSARFSEPAQLREILRTALYTPACGLALHSVADAHNVLAALIEFEERLEKWLG